jgi:hypothetical protein
MVGSHFNKLFADRRGQALQTASSKAKVWRCRVNLGGLWTLEDSSRPKLDTKVTLATHSTRNCSLDGCNGK